MKRGVDWSIATAGTREWGGRERAREKSVK